jgi:hypothetical protein
MQLIYKGANATGSIPLAEFVAMFGADDTSFTTTILSFTALYQLGFCNTVLNLQPCC